MLPADILEFVRSAMVRHRLPLHVADGRVLGFVCGDCPPESGPPVMLARVVPQASGFPRTDFECPACGHATALPVTLDEVAVRRLMARYSRGRAGSRPASSPDLSCRPAGHAGPWGRLSEDTVCRTREGPAPEDLVETGLDPDE